jgi:hypothetical protein
MRRVLQLVRPLGSHARMGLDPARGASPAWTAVASSALFSSSTPDLRVKRLQAAAQRREKGRPEGAVKQRAPPPAAAAATTALVEPVKTRPGEVTVSDPLPAASVLVPWHHHHLWS